MFPRHRRSSSRKCQPLAGGKRVAVEHISPLLRDYVHMATLTACVRVHGPGGKLSHETRSFGSTSDEWLSLHDWLSAQRVSCLRIIAGH